MDLRPLGWEFPPSAGEWDDRWLVIRGMVTSGDRDWAFTEPCLLIDEARELAAWLRDGAEGRIAPHPPTVDAEPSLSFMEPALGLSLVARNEGELVLDVHFAAEAAPPWLPEESPPACHILQLRVHPSRLLAAADSWAEELDALPARPWVDPRS